MGNLNFNTEGNNADFINRAEQMRTAIRTTARSLEAQGYDTNASLQQKSANNGEPVELTKNILKEVQHIGELISNAIVTLNKIEMENQMRLTHLEANLSMASSTKGVAQNFGGNGAYESSASKGIQSEMESCTSLLKEINLQMTSLKQLQTELSGVKSVLDGVSGAFSAASGILELFGIENETLQRIMQKVQIAISITNGLEEVSQVLHKNSAFQINVLGQLKMWWRNITIQAAAAQGIETTAVSMGTIANLGLAGSFRAIGLAIKSIPLMGWILAGISALIDVCMLWTSKTDEQTKAQTNLNQSMNDFGTNVQRYAASPIAMIELLSAKFKALGDDINAQKKFITDSKKYFDEWGVSIRSVKDAQQLLIDNKTAFINAQIAKATSLAYSDKMQEEAKKYIDSKMAADVWQRVVDKRQKEAEQKNSTSYPVVGNQALNIPIISSEFEQAKANGVQGDWLDNGGSYNLNYALSRKKFHEKNADAYYSKMNAYGTQSLFHSEKERKITEQFSGNGSSSGRSIDTRPDLSIVEREQRLSALLESQSQQRSQMGKKMEEEYCQSQIDAMEEGSQKIIAQMLSDQDRQLEELEREKTEYLEKKRKDAEEKFNAIEDIEMAKDPKRKGQTFDPSTVQLDERETLWFNTKESNLVNRQNKEVSQYFASEKQAMDEYLAAYGNYEEKRQAIIDLAETQKKGKNDGEKRTIDAEKIRSLSDLDQKVNKDKSAFGRLYSDMKNQTVENMYGIADRADGALDFLRSKRWDATQGEKYGMSEETFQVMSNDSDAMNDTKKKIKALREEANACDTAFNRLGVGLEKAFDAKSDPKQLKEALCEIEGAFNEIMQSAQFLSGCLSSLGDSFGNDTLSGIADGIGVAMDAAGAAMEGAKAGAMFGPIGSAAGAAIGMVSSLASSFAKIHDAKNEKRIQQMQEQIDALTESYDDLGEAVDKAYSSDASQLIDQQNTLLTQQKVLIRNQIAEEQNKKKSDAGRIKEWEDQIKEIDKTIANNKERQIDAIFGEDLKSAIDNFAQAYADAWSAGDDRAKSSKDLVKNMIKQMIMESLKAASSQPMEELRKKLAGYYSDGIISDWEREQIEKDAEAISKDLDSKFGWADEYMKGDEESTSQNSSKGGFETMSQETGNELNGRFTAIQIANEEIRSSMLYIVGNLTSMSASVANGNITLIEMRNLAVLSNSYLHDIAGNTKRIMIDFGSKLDNIERSSKIMAGN